MQSAFTKNSLKALKKARLESLPTVVTGCSRPSRTEENDIRLSHSTNGVDRHQLCNITAVTPLAVHIGICPATMRETGVVPLYRSGHWCTSGRPTLYHVVTLRLKERGPYNTWRWTRALDASSVTRSLWPVHIYYSDYPLPAYLYRERVGPLRQTCRFSHTRDGCVNSVFYSLEILSG